MSIFPGNEIYEKRFEFLLQVVLSNHLLNGSKKVSKKIIKKLLDEVGKLNWIMFEDWTPIRLDEKRKILHRRIDEIKNAPINQIVSPLASRIRQPTFSERRINSWATAYLNKEDKMAEWASRSSESRK